MTSRWRQSVITLRIPYPNPDPRTMRSMINSRRVLVPTALLSMGMGDDKNGNDLPLTVLEAGNEVDSIFFP